MKSIPCSIPFQKKFGTWGLGLTEEACNRLEGSTLTEITISDDGQTKATFELNNPDDEKFATYDVPSHAIEFVEIALFYYDHGKAEGESNTDELEKTLLRVSKALKSSGYEKPVADFLTGAFEMIHDFAETVEEATNETLQKTRAALEEEEKFLEERRQATNEKIEAVADSFKKLANFLREL